MENGSGEGVALLTGPPQSPISFGQQRISPSVFTDHLGCKSNFIVVSKNLLCKQNNNPGSRIAEGFCVRVGICLFITSSPECPFKGARKAKCPCVFWAACVHLCTREGEREREGGRLRAYRN